MQKEARTEHAMEPQGRGALWKSIIPFGDVRSAVYPPSLLCLGLIHTTKRAHTTNNPQCKHTPTPTQETCRPQQQNMQCHAAVRTAHHNTRTLQCGITQHSTTQCNTTLGHLSGRQTKGWTFPPKAVWERMAKGGYRGPILTTSRPKKTTTGKQLCQTGQQLTTQS